MLIFPLFTHKFIAFEKTTMAYNGLGKKIIMLNALDPFDIESGKN